MTVDFNSLITQVTKEGALRRFMSSAALAEMPVTAWGDGGTGRNILEASSELFAETSATIAQLARMNLIRFARGDFLTVAAREWYDFDREVATFAAGNFTVATGAGTTLNVVAAGQLVAKGPGGRIYRNTGLANIGPNSSATIAFVADGTGSAYNLPDGTITELTPPIAGVTITNAVSGQPSWLTSPGLDEEKDDRLILRCITKWATLALGAVPDTYKAWALASSPQISRVRVIEASAQGDPFRVIMAGPSGPISSALVTGAQNYIEGTTGTAVKRLRPVNVAGQWESAVARSIVLSALIKAPGNKLSTVQSAALVALADHAASVEIGDEVVQAQLTDRIIQAGATNVIWTVVGDTALASNEVPTFNAAGLVFVGV